MKTKFMVYGLSTGLFLLFTPHISESYQGLLKCEKLDEEMRYFPPIHVGRFCSDAINNCDVMKKLKALKAEDPLRLDMEEEFNRHFKLSLEVCELAIYAYDKDYYNSHLKRSPQAPAPENYSTQDLPDQDVQ